MNGFKVLSYLKKAALGVAFLINGMLMSESSFAYDKDNKPDFAFPVKVEKDADAALKKALAEKDDVVVLQSLIRLIAARNAVSADSFTRNVTLLDSVAQSLASPYSNLAYLLEAGMYAQLYSVSPWQFNNRTLPLDSFPDNPMEWSGDLFAKKVMELVDKANCGLGVARTVPIEKLKPLLTNYDYAEKSHLTVADFIVYRSASLLGNFATSRNQRIIPFFSDPAPVATGVREECGLRQMEIIDSLYEWRMQAGDTAALVAAVRLKTDYMPYEEREAFLGMWVSKLAESPESALLIHDYMQYIPGDPEKGWKRKKMLYDMIRDYIERFPQSEYDSLMKYDEARLSEQRASLEVPDKAMSAATVKGSFTGENMKSAYVLLYSVPESIVPMNSLNLKEFPGKASFIKAIKVDLEGSVPFSATKEFELPPLTPGYYVVIPSSAPSLASDWRKKVDSWSISVINVTDISLITSINRLDKGSGKVYVVDAGSQRPIAGAEVKFYPDNSVKKVMKTLVTGKDGSVDAPEGFLRMRVSKGNSVVWQSSDIHYDNPKARVANRASLLTDLSVYKPGDQVGFSVVAWSNKGHENTLMKDSRLKVILRDANWNQIDTLEVITDSFGRGSGKFMLPQSGLLGRYRIAVAEAGKTEEFGSQSFQVAEYKTPTFFVTIESDKESSYEVGDTICFTGEVKTFSGMPLAGLEVNYSVNWHQWWRWWSDGIDDAFYSSDVTTGSDGKFVIKLPTASLKGTPYERGVFQLSATVTSPSGETQSSSTLSFALGKGFSISPDIPDEGVEVIADTVRFNVPVYDILSHPVVKKVTYDVADLEGKRLFEGSFESPVLNVPSSKLPSGEYKISFKLDTDTVAVDRRLIIWRPTDAKPPVATPLWLPEKEIIVPSGASTVEIKVGSGYAGSWILCQISDENRIIERRWIAADDKNISVSVEAPEGDSRRWVSFTGMHDFSGKSEKVTLIPEESTKKMKVTTLSFRDKISAGDKEKWVFSFNVADSVQAHIPAMAVMSNKALDAIYPFSWNFSLGGDSWYDYSRIVLSQKYNRTVSAHFSVLPRFRQPDTSLPEWNTYNRLLAGASSYGLTVRGGGRMMMKARATSVTDDAVPEPEEVSAEVMVMENQVLMSAAPMADMAVMSEKKAEDDFEAVADADAGNNGATGATQKVEPRPVEMPLAFFMPSLSSDGEGNVKVEFTTPNFNTTWKFQLLGYNEELKSAALTLEAVASKPVMVQSNPPRYLRSGDKASLVAVLFNNSPDPQMLHGEIEIFNPVTGETIASRHLGAEETAPGANRSFSIDFTVGTEITALGMRAYAYAGSHADGEQTLIPVLPSSTPVIESTQFYLGAGKEEFSLQLPKFRKNASITLKYCANPIWECLLALPSIATPSSNNILSLSRAFYANGMARGIVGTYPAVRNGLERVMAAKEGEGKATLTSALQKDSLLKTVALVNTPWVNNAEAETMRMLRLGELLDTKKLDNAIADLVKRISALQNPDGGWSWCEGMRSSEFITSRVLSDIAPLLAYDTDKETAAMASKAIRYCDNSLYDDYVKNDKRFSTISMLRYLYVRQAFDKGNGRTGFSGLKREALKAIDKEWKSFSIYDKATAALVLNAETGYEKTVRLILESLRQLASKSETKGWWYDNLSSGWNAMPKLITTARVLEAFSVVEPATEAIDGLRQWLVLQKETQDWGDDTYTANVISAIMASGTSWTAEAPSPSVKLGGKPVDIAGSEMLTGIITVSLTPSEASGKVLSISRDASGVPAWGGVLSQYVAPISDVKADKCENLKIEKQILLVKDDEGVETTEKVKGSLKIGDKVRVTLTLTCSKDMDYVALIDERSACLEPVDQLSGYRFADGLAAYREIRDTRTSFFISFLPKGVNVISYDCYVDREGEYALGIASVQSQYSPLQSAHSAGNVIKVE